MERAPGGGRTRDRTLEGSCVTATPRARVRQGIPMEIRRVHPGEWRALRDLRLRALLDAPEAFGGTYEESSARPDERWIEWARALAESDQQALFVAADK